MVEDLVEWHAFIDFKTGETTPDLRCGVNQPPVQDPPPSAVTDDHTVEYKYNTRGLPESTAASSHEDHNQQRRS